MNVEGHPHVLDGIMYIRRNDASSTLLFHPGHSTGIMFYPIQHTRLHQEQSSLCETSTLAVGFGPGTKQAQVTRAQQAFCRASQATRMALQVALMRLLRVRIVGT